MERLFTTILSIITISPLILSANSGWSLERCIQYALKSSLEIADSEVRLKIKEDELKSSKLEFLPSISAGLNHNINWGRSVDQQELIIIKDQVSLNTSGTILFELTIMDGLNRYFRLQSSKIGVDIENYAAKSSELKIKVEITEMYLQLLLSMQLYKEAVSNRDITQKQYDIYLKLAEIGEKERSEVSALSAQLAKDNLRVVEYSSEVAKNKLSLQQKINYIESDFEIDNNNLYSMEVYPPTYYVDFKYTHHLINSLPEIQIAELELKLREIDHKSALWAYLPHLYFTASYGTYYSSTIKERLFDQFANNYNPSISLTLNIPIFDKLHRRYEIKRAKHQVTLAQNSQKRRELEMRYIIETAKLDISNTYNKFISAKESMRSAQDNFNSTYAKFREGSASSTDFFIAKERLSQSKSLYNSTICNYIMKIKILEYYNIL
jgi:outer membrane protein